MPEFYRTSLFFHFVQTVPVGFGSLHDLTLFEILSARFGLSAIKNKSIPKQYQIIIVAYFADLKQRYVRVIRYNLFGMRDYFVIVPVVLAGTAGDCQFGRFCTAAINFVYAPNSAATMPISHSDTSSNAKVRPSVLFESSSAVME